MKDIETILQALVLSNLITPVILLGVLACGIIIAIRFKKIKKQLEQNKQEEKE